MNQCHNCSNEAGQELFCLTCEKEGFHICENCQKASKFSAYTEDKGGLVCVPCLSLFKSFDINRFQLVKLIASFVENQRKEKNLNQEKTVSLFITLLKDNRFSQNNWFNIDDTIRKTNESDNWFWLIRTVRNNPSYWEMNKNE